LAAKISLWQFDGLYLQNIRQIKPFLIQTNSNEEQIDGVYPINSISYKPFFLFCIPQQGWLSGSYS
jgi:hypothetical protein